MPWSTLTISEKTIDIYEPAGKPRFGLIFLHPYDGTTLRDHPVFTPLLEAKGLACVCPIAPESWWTDRPCTKFPGPIYAERFVLDRVLPFFETRWQLSPRAVGIFGLGMGGQGALRLAFKNADKFQVAAGIAAALDFHDCYGYGLTLDEMYDSREQCRQDTALMHVPPYDPPQHLFFCIDALDPEWVRGNDRLHEKLNALGVAHTHDLDQANGLSGWSYAKAQARRVVDFLFDGLVHQSRRLL